jgi:hypothetical protein
VRLAPDWSRYAVSRDVEGLRRAGWVDAQTKFTDVAAGEAIGFDAMGNFFYRVMQDDQSLVYRLPNGQTSGGAPVSYLPSGAGSVFKRDGTGRLVDVSSCPTFAADWLSSTDYLHALGTQIFRTNIGTTPGLVDCESPVGTPLLPADTTSAVSDPVASPDRTKVAYLRDGSQLWMVDAKGGRNPTRVNVSGIDLGAARNTVLAGWTASTPSFGRPQDFSRKPDMTGTWTGDYFSPGLQGTGWVSLHVDMSDPLSGSIVTKSGDLACNSAVKETARTVDSLSVEITLKAGADPRCRGTSTLEFAWLGDRLSGVIVESSEASYVGGTLIVGRR